MVATAAAVAAATRARSVAVSRALAVVIGATYLVEHAYFIARGTWSLDFNLPLHLTDVVTVVSVLALWTARPLLVELTWFWGLTASLQAVLTPDLGSADFPELPVVDLLHHALGCGGGGGRAGDRPSASSRAREPCGACSARRSWSPSRRARRTC